MAKQARSRGSGRNTDCRRRSVAGTTRTATGDRGYAAARRVVLAVGEFNEQYLRRAWGSVQRVARIRFPDDVENEEITEHAAIYLCRDPQGTWAQLWPRLRHLS